MPMNRCCLAGWQRACDSIAPRRFLAVHFPFQAHDLIAAWTMGNHAILLVGVGTTAIIWLSVLALRVSMVHACLACLLVASCFGVPFASWEASGGITLSLDRLFLACLLAFFALKRLLVVEPPVRLERQDGLLLLFLGISAFGVLLVPWSPDSPKDIPPWYRLSAAFLAPALVYWMTRHRSRTAQDAETVCRFLVIFGLYLAVTAVAETHGFRALVFPRYILEPRTVYVGRAVGPFLSSPQLGTWLTIASVAAVLMLERLRGFSRIGIVALLVLFAYAQFLTETRSAWLGFAVAVPLMLLSARLPIPRSVVGVGVLTVGLLLAVTFGGRFLVPERAEGRSVVAYSAAQRLALLDGAVTLFAQKPLLGWGFGQFEHAAQRDVGTGVLGFATTGAAEGLASHNALLRVLVETGVVGASIFIAIFWIWFWQARRQQTAADSSWSNRHLGLLFIGALVAYWSEAMFHDVTHILQGNLVLFFLAGCLGRNNETEPSHPATRPDPQ